MRKTLLTRLLCMLLITALPLVSLAEASAPADAVSTTGDLNLITISLTPGEELRQMQPIADLCDVLSIELYSSQSDVAGLSVLLDKQSVLSANFRADDEGIFIDSKEIYGEPLYFSVEDLQAFFEEMMQASGADAATIAQFQQSFSMGMQSAMIAEQNADDDGFATGDLSDPKVRQVIINAMGGDDSYLLFIEGLLERAVDTKGEFTGADHDPATRKRELLITQADISALLDTTYIRQQIKNQLATGYRAPTGAALDQEVDESIQEAKDELAKMDILIPVTALYDEDDSLVFISLPIAVKGKDESNAFEFSMATDYRRLTTDGNANHHFQMAAKPAETETAFVDVLVNQYENGNYDLDFTITANDQTVFSAKGIYEISENQTVALLSLVPADSGDMLFQFEKTKAENGDINYHFQMSVKGDAPKTMLVDAMVNQYESGNYDLDFTVKGDEETYFSAKGIYEISGDQTAGLLSLLPADSEEVIFLFEQAKTETGADNHLSFYMRTGAAEQMVLTDADKPFFTLNVSTAVVADDGRLDAINAATSETSTQMLKLGAEERNAFEATVMATVQQAAMNAMAKLPSSIVSLIFGTADTTAPVAEPMPTMDLAPTEAPE